MVERIVLGTVPTTDSVRTIPVRPMSITGQNSVPTKTIESVIFKSITNGFLMKTANVRDLH